MQARVAPSAAGMTAERSKAGTTPRQLRAIDESSKREPRLVCAGERSPHPVPPGVRLAIGSRPWTRSMLWD